MVSANLLLKVLGGASIVAVGATGTYLLIRNYSDAVSDQAIKSTENWEVETSPDKVDKDKTNIEIRVKWSGDKKTWISKIQGFIETHDKESTLDINEQANTLKKELGIKDDKKRDPNIQQNFKKFIENSKKHKTKSTNTSFESVINLGKIEAKEKKYKFDDKKLKDLYDGTKEILNKLKITKTELDKEQEIKEGELKSIKFTEKTDLIIENNSKITIKIEKTDYSSFPEGLKFTLKSDKDIKNKVDGKEQPFLSANANAEFKIKINDEDYSLEKTTK